MKYEDFKLLFNKNINITLNGIRVAYGLPAVYRYFIRLRRQKPLLESHLRKLLVDGHQAAIQYQTVVQHKGQKYRSLTMAIIEFKGHKLLEWNLVSHTIKLKN